MKHNTLHFAAAALALAAMVLSCRRIDPVDNIKKEEEPENHTPDLLVGDLSTTQTGTVGEDGSIPLCELAKFESEEGAAGTEGDSFDWDKASGLFSRIYMSIPSGVVSVDLWSLGGEGLCGEFTLHTAEEDWRLELPENESGLESHGDKGLRDKVHISDGGKALPSLVCAVVFPGSMPLGVGVLMTREDGRVAQKFVTRSIATTGGKLVNLGDLTSGLSWQKPGVPRMYVTVTENPSLTEIADKENYVLNYVHVEPCCAENVNGDTPLVSTGASGRIRGRGNSTWTLPKKPYRLKMDRKVKFCGFAKAKDYVLLADFLDCTHMLNAMAFKSAQILGMEYANTAVPVELWINGTYKGAYCLTEQVEVDEHRTDIPKESGAMLEFDAGLDGEYKFVSSIYSLPIILKDPDEAEAGFATLWQPNFNSAMSALRTAVNNGYQSIYGIDLRSAAQYLLAYNLFHNMELNHPKSVYIHKTWGGDWIFGPIWDFDWTCGFEIAYHNGTPLKHYGDVTSPLLGLHMADKPGCKFFSDIIRDPRVAAEYDAVWAEFKRAGLDSLLAYGDAYAAAVKESALRDGALWDGERRSNINLQERSADFDNLYSKLRKYLVDRSAFLTSEIASGKRCGI